MTYTAQSLLNAALSASASGLIDPSLVLSDVTATVTDDAINLSGSASKGEVSVTVAVPVADIDGLLGLIAASLNADAKAAPTKPAPAAKAKPAPAAKVEPEPAPVAAPAAPVVAAVEDDDDSF